MARKLTVEILGDSSSLEKAYRRSSSAGKKWSDDISHVSRGAAVATVGFRGLGRSIAFASAGFLAGASLTAGIKGVISSASDLNEEVNKSNVVFGASAQQVQRWSRTTANASGIARAAALEAAGGFGSILETSGLAEGAAAKMSTRLVGLAGDIASFNNIDPAQALEKLRSGLVGEAEPLRTVGVLLSESRVKQEAYRLGLAKTGATLTDAQKVQARYSIILQDTARQQGDFARTSDGLANAQRRVKASLTDIAASIGSAILPGLASATSGFADFLGEIQQAKSLRAKLDVVIDTGESIGRSAIEFGQQLVDRYDQVLRSTNWGRLANTLLTEVEQVLGRINWRAVGSAIGGRVIAILNALTSAFQGIDWGQLGKVVVRGLVRGIVNFIKGVDWVALVKAIVRLLLAAEKASASLLLGIGKELAHQLWLGLKAGLAALAKLVEIAAIKIALAFLRPLDFTVLGHHIIPGLDGLITSMETKLDALATSAETSASRVNAAVGSMDLRAPSGIVAPTETTTTTPTVTVKPPKVVVPPGTTKATETALERAQKAFAKVIDALNFKAQQAEATRTLKDDIRAQEAINAAIRKEIGVEGKTTDLARQLFEGRQKLADLGRQQRTQDQFRALGLTAEGDQPVAGVRSLLKRVASLRDRVKGTVLDTPKTTAELNRIANVLKGKFGKVGRDVREAIVGMLNDIASGFGDKGAGSDTGPLTRFGKTGVKKLIAGLGLTEEQVKEFRQRFASFGPLVPATAGAGARAGTQRRPPAHALPGEHGPAEIVLHVYIDGHEVESTVTKRQQKKRGRTRPQRRGVRPGL